MKSKFLSPLQVLGLTAFPAAVKSKICFALTALAAVALFSGSAQGVPGDRPYPLKAALNSIQVVPANGSTARARCKATGELVLGESAAVAPAIQVVCEFSGLSGALTGVDIRSARNGENGAGLCEQEKTVTVTLPNTGSGTATIGCLGQGSPFPPPLHLKGHYIVLQTALYPDGEIRGQLKPTGFDIDVDGEGRAEVSLFRPSEGLAYSFSDIGNQALVSRLNWNPATDSVPFLSDFDGDGIADWSFTRTAQTGSMQTLWLSSWGNYVGGCGFGNTNFGDIYAYGDYNGNGTTDCAVFRTGTGEWWFFDNTASFPQVTSRTWGGTGPGTPCPGDYDADGKTDLCLIRNEGGQLIWSILFSQGGEIRISWGLTTDEVFTKMPADFDGDGASEIYVARIENGRRYFWILNTATGEWRVRQWGLDTDTVKIADYDGDGVSDLAAIRETDGHLVWYINQSHDGQLHVDHWGLPGDK